MKKTLKLVLLSIILLLSIIPDVTGIYKNFGINYSYIIKPLIWVFIFIIVIVFFRNDVIPDREHKKRVSYYVIIASLIYFTIYFGIGYIKEFQYNPYDNSLQGLVLNLWTILPILITREYARYYMINNCDKKHIILNAISISLLFLILNIDVINIPNYFSSSYLFIKLLIEILIPNFTMSLYLTYISYYSGYEITILYKLLPQLALYLLPILPNTGWMLLSILDTSVPFFSYVYINYVISKKEHTYDKKEGKVVGRKGWFLMISFVFVMICFGLGVFAYKPLVIATNSMYPKIHKGDIVLVKDVNPKKLKEGDIIKYQLDNYFVVHRIKEVKTLNGKKVFITKGDNNQTVDIFLVKESQVKGIVKKDIRYVGYPTLLLGKLLNVNVEDNVSVETGK